MSEEKTLKARVVHKHKTEAEWRLDVYDGDTLREDAFIPKNGELIIFDEDETHSYRRFKFGNGVDNVVDLSFSISAPMQEGFGENSLRQNECNAIGVNSVALGEETCAGVKGYYIKAIKYYQTGDEEYWYALYLDTITSTTNIPIQPKIEYNQDFDDSSLFDTSVNLLWSTDDIIYINTGKKWWLPSISAITGNRIDLNMVPHYVDFEEPSEENSMAYTIFSKEHPTNGIVEIGNWTLASNINTQAIGNYSTAFGYNNVALGWGSFITGHTNIGDGPQTFIHGYNNIATGNQSYAGGAGNRADGDFSHAEGRATQSSGEAAHAEGHSTKATAPRAHAEGYNTIASGQDSHTEGSGTKAEALRAHAEGWTTTASGEQSHAEGRVTKAYGESSHAEGKNTSAGAEGNAYGIASHAEGYQSKTIGNYSHAEGQGTTAGAVDSNGTVTGMAAHAEGLTTVASGNYSHAEGSSSQATGAKAHAEGWSTKATGEQSHAEGRSTLAQGESSHAGGQGTIASATAQTAIGTYNKKDDDALFIVGNGDSDSNRANAFVIKKDGTIINNDIDSLKPLVITDSDSIKTLLENTSARYVEVNCEFPIDYDNDYSITITLSDTIEYLVFNTEIFSDMGTVSAITLTGNEKCILESCYSRATGLTITLDNFKEVKNCLHSQSGGATVNYSQIKNCEKVSNTYSHKFENCSYIRDCTVLSYQENYTAIDNADIVKNITFKTLFNDYYIDDREKVTSYNVSNVTCVKNCEAVGTYTNCDIIKDANGDILESSGIITKILEIIE